MKLLASDAMALAIDYQIRLLPSIPDSDLLLKRSSLLLEGLRLLKIPTLITQQYTRGLGMSHPSIFQSAGTDKYLEKITFSCYQSDTIRQTIQDLHRPQIILCGIEAHICVLQTALDLLDAGFSVVFAGDCISSRHSRDRSAAFERLIQAGAIPTTAEALLYELMVTAEHPAFKKISGLVKQG